MSAESNEQYFPAEETNEVVVLNEPVKESNERKLIPVKDEYDRTVGFVEKEKIVEGDATEVMTEEQIKQFVQDPTVRANALVNAQDIQKKLKGWFRLQDLIRKGIFTKVEPAIDVLKLLCLLEMCYQKEHRGEMRYHIKLSKEDRLKILNEELKEAQRKVSDLQAQIKQITNL